MEAKPYKIAGIPVACAHCEHTDFFKEESEFMGEALAGLLRLRKEVNTYICASCGHLMWFLPQEEEAEATEIALEDFPSDEEAPQPMEQYQGDASSVSEPTECLSCGEMIPSYQTKCPACGWSYRSEPEGKED